MLTRLLIEIIILNRQIIKSRQLDKSIFYKGEREMYHHTRLLINRKIFFAVFVVCFLLSGCQNKLHDTNTALTEYEINKADITRTDNVSHYKLYFQISDDSLNSEKIDSIVTIMQKRLKNIKNCNICYDNNIIIDMYMNDEEKLEDVICLILKTGEFYLLPETDNSGNIIFHYSGNTTSGYTLNHSIQELKNNGSIIFDGNNIKGITTEKMPSLNKTDMGFCLKIKLDDTGKEQLGLATEKAYQNNENVAFYYNNDIYSVVKVNGIITDGECYFTGFTDKEEAEEAAECIIAGAYPSLIEFLKYEIIED